MPSQKSRLRAPKPGERITWVPKGSGSPQSAPQAPQAPGAPQTPTNEIGGVERAQLHEQAVRLSEGRSPAEAGHGMVPVGQGSTHDSETTRQLDEQRARFSDTTKE